MSQIVQFPTFQRCRFKISLKIVHPARLSFFDCALQQLSTIYGQPMILKPAGCIFENAKKETALTDCLYGLCWHRPIFPVRRQTSIFGTDELNFRVRNGNGWTLIVKNTN